MSPLFFLLFVQILNFLQVQSHEVEKLPEANGSTFYYFGYGSNMLTKFATAVKTVPGNQVYYFGYDGNTSTKNIHAQNPTAVKTGPGDKFYYFGYGSNMLTKRIHIQNPTAVKIGPGSLQDYRLDFNLFSGRWNGSAATVVEHPNRIVQGTLWEIDMENLEDLDDQEGVPDGLYKPLSLSIIQLSNNKPIMARVYVLVNQPITDLQEYDHASVPFIRQPSKTYLQCLVKGAIETGLSHNYTEMLKSIKHNGRVRKSLEDSLELKDVQLNS